MSSVQDHRLPGPEAAFARLGSAISRFYEAAAASLGLNRADVDCIVLLQIEGAVPAGRLAELTGLTTGGITGVLDRLERAGLVVREPDPVDRRRVLVRIAAGQDERLSVAASISALLAGASQGGPRDALFAERAASAVEAGIAALRQSEPRPVTPGDDGSISVPMPDSNEAALEIAGGANRIDLVAADLEDQLMVARLPEGSARVSVEGSRIRLSGRRLALLARGSGAMHLSSAVTWTIAIRGGANVVDANLAGLRLAELSIAGGITSGSIEVGAPRGTVPVRINGGATTLVLRRPSGVATRLRMAGGMGEVRIDGGGVTSGPRIDWQSPAYEGATDRYDITIRGGITRLTVEEAAGHSL